MNIKKGGMKVNIKKMIKIVSLSLSVIVLSTSIGEFIYAEENINSQNSELTNYQSYAETDFGDLSNIDDDNELLDKYDLGLDDIERLENEKNNFDMSSDISDVYSDEQVKLLKLEFQNTYGTEDMFVVANTSDEVKTEINGAKGIIKTTLYDSEGNIADVTEVNYFESLDNLRDNSPYTEIESRATTIVPSSSYGTGTVASIFAPRIKVSRDTRDRITITSTTKSRTKSYSKAKYNWNSGNTLVFYDTIKSARSQWSDIGYSLSAGTLSAVAGYVSGLIGASVVVPPLATVTAALSAIGITYSTVIIARKTVLFLGSMLKISNTYKKV